MGKQWGLPPLFTCNKEAYPSNLGNLRPFYILPKHIPSTKQNF